LRKAINLTLIAGRKINLGAKGGHTEDGESKKRKAEAVRHRYIYISVMDCYTFRLFFEKAIIRQFKDKK
jgi:hypothetical protein